MENEAVGKKKKERKKVSKQHFKYKNEVSTMIFIQNNEANHFDRRKEELHHNISRSQNEQNKDECLVQFSKDQSSFFLYIYPMQTLPHL